MLTGVFFFFRVCWVGLGKGGWVGDDGLDRVRVVGRGGLGWIQLGFFAGVLYAPVICRSW